MDGAIGDLNPGAVVQSHLEVHAPARYNDIVVIDVRVAHLGRTSYTFHYLFTNKRTRLITATGVLTLVWLDAQFLPTELPARFRQVVEEFERGTKGG
jgi:acyl-CoA thioesterase FadM